MSQQYNCNQQMDIKYDHQELIDFPEIIKQFEDKWLNQTNQIHLSDKIFPLRAL